MTAVAGHNEGVFLSTLPAGRGERRLALAVVLLALMAFTATAPFARTQLARVDAFIPAYQAALAISDLITAVLLFGQFSILRLTGLRILASAYLFTAAMVIVHTLSFPGLFAPGGLLGAGPQTTAWLYMFWHGGFPLLVLCYARCGRTATRADYSGTIRAAIIGSIVGVLAAVIALTLLVTTWQGLLPSIMDGNHYTPLMIGVVSAVWLIGLAALIALLMRRPHSVLDLWLTVVLCAWLLDIALSVVLNAGRFDLGFYAGRIYGVMAASFVLLVLLLETRSLYARLAGSLERQVVERTEQLHASEERYGYVVDLIQEAIWIHQDGRIVYANPYAVRMFGAESLDQLIGLPVFSLIHPDDRARAQERTRQAIDGGQALPLTDMKVARLDGKTITAELHGLSFVKDGKAHMIACGRDVTAQREADAKLQQAQKMESVGQLTGGVAHDFNNLLTVVIGGLDAVVDRVPADLRPSVDSALRAADRGAGLIRKLLAFSRRQVLAPERLDLNKLTAGMDDLLRRTLGAQVEIEMALQEGTWPVLADKGQLENALLNLAINARDAMAGGGKLTIETDNIHLDEDYAASNPEVKAGDYAMLAVTDTGTGMPPDVVARAFEPFFTTKAAGKGTGLGLSMIYGFAKQSAGHLKIYSEVGHGTTMRLYLPRQAAGEAVATASKAVSASDLRGDESILVVEDDPLVRNLVAMQLRELGYRVVEAADGPKARRILDSDQPIDLMLTDVVMPGGMTGRQLADVAQRQRPKLKTLYTSGYTEDAIAHQGKLDTGANFLSKPFRRQDLALKIRAVLDAA